MQQAIMAHIKDSRRGIDTLSGINESVAIVANLPIRLVMVKSPFLLLNADSSRLTINQAYMDTIFFCLGYVLYVERSRYEFTTTPSKDNTRPAMAKQKKRSSTSMTFLIKWKALKKWEA